MSILLLVGSQHFLLFKAGDLLLTLSGDPAHNMKHKENCECKFCSKWEEEINFSNEHPVYDSILTMGASMGRILLFAFFCSLMISVLEVAVFTVISETLAEKNIECNYTK